MGKWTPERAEGYVSVDLGPGLKQATQDAARSAGLSVSAWLREVLTDTLRDAIQ